MATNDLCAVLVSHDATTSQNPSVIQFDVESAGCEACARLVTDALTALGNVQRLEIDEAADVVRVVFEPAGVVTRYAVDDVLRGASGAGHEYRVRSGSWRSA